MILIQPMLTEHLLAGTSLAMEQMDAKKSEIVFLPHRAYYIVLNVVYRPAESALSGNQLEM